MLASVPFNLLPKFLSVITDAGERQLNEPGFNAVDNCGPAAGSVLMQVLGYQDIEPQAWTDYEYWPAYRGGETYEALNDFIASHYPNPPIMSIESPGDQLAAIDQWGSAGLLVIGLFWSTSGAVYQPFRTGIGHFGLILGYNGVTVTTWNPELGVQDLSVALFKGASQNLYDICHRPISSTGATAGSEVTAGGVMPISQPDAEAFVRLAFVAGQGHEPTPAQLTQRSGAMVAAGGAAEQVMEILDSAESQAWLKKLSGLASTAGAAGPVGPPGPPGPPGTPAPTHLKVSGILDVIQ